MANSEPHLLNIKQRQLIAAVLKILRKYPAGISEYQLLKELVTLGLLDPPSNNPSKKYESHELFKVHFLLFHHLYLLQNRLGVKQRLFLKICPTSIQLLAYRNNPVGLDLIDPLKEYYLDISELTQTGAEDVNHMLDKFWLGFLSPDSVVSSLNILGLAPSANSKDIKSRYRKLAMKHHPDRGGDPEKLKEIHQAIKVLKSHFNY